MKEKVLGELSKRCEEFGIVEDDRFSALRIAQILDISRNTVSQYLSEAVKEGIVVKVNTRPVHFYMRDCVEKEFSKSLESNVFESFDVFFALRKKELKDFEKLIGYDNSLRGVVEQCKAAISYPGNGLPILIHGATGTGKSMIASLLYEFAIGNELISNDKKFVAVNCSEYANNPELLTANLFGHVKGAYTGADEDNLGLISVANGGLLFLDEVHCLPAECQEKLFFFMDKGMYHQVGDNEHWLTSHCRLVFATTENPQTVLLKTLLRRIPIIVTVPSLKERPLIEKKSLIHSIFVKEESRLSQKLNISNVVYQALMDFDFGGNVGGMKNVIKATYANAFLNHHNREESLDIHVYDLPDYVLELIPTLQSKASKDINDTMIPLAKLEGPVALSTPLIHQYERMIERYEAFASSNEPFACFIADMKVIMQNYIDYLVYKNRYRKQANDNFMLKLMDKIYSIIMNKYSLKIANSEIQVYSNVVSDYTKYVIDAKVWVSSHSQEVSELIHCLEDHSPRELTIAKEIVANAALNLDVVLDDMMLSILTFSMISYEHNQSSSQVAVILCHGYSTASSIADATNRMLGEYIFDGIDMELNISVDKIVEQLNEYLKQKGTFDELILLVDMGSLEEIYTRIQPIANCNIGIINNVTTKLTIEVGNGIQREKSISDILENIKDDYALSTHYIEGRAKKEAILTICATGFGTAKKISELLISSLPTKIPYEIIPYEYQALVENGNKDTIFSRYHIDLIIGTLDPKVEGKMFIPVESIVMDDGIQELENLISDSLSEKEMEVFKQNLMKNFTLSNIVNHLTILNAEKVIEDVEDVVDILENDLDIHLDRTRKAGLYVHLSCLIERLMLKSGVEVVEGMEEQKKKYAKEIELIKLGFSGVEMRYSVEVPGVEILFVLNYFQNA